jgi:hypothetical protein
MTFEQGRGTTTTLFHNLLGEVKAFGAQLVIFDTLSDVFAGSEIDRSQARQFVQQCPALIAREIGGAVVCCAHPSLTGVNSASGNSGNSGSTAWPGAFRSHLYLVPKAQDGEEPVSTKKLETKRLLRKHRRRAKHGAGPTSMKSSSATRNHLPNQIVPNQTVPVWMVNHPPIRTAEQRPGDFVKTIAGELGPGLDVRGDGGSLILPQGLGRSWDRILGPDLPLLPMPVCGWRSQKG